MANGLLNSFANNILLSNLIYIRWIAIVGQLIAILVVYFLLDINIPIVACLFVVSISVIINIIFFFKKRVTNYLSDAETFYFLLFDTLQLAILLYLTGGIYNPFSLLLIAPLIISASYLKIYFSFILSIFSIIIVILISFFYIEIKWPGNFDVPDIFTFGLILSFIISLIFITIYVYTFASSSREISKALEVTRAALYDQRKLSEIGSLSAAAVHELSTPLNTIFLILDDLRKNDSLIKKIEIKQEIELLKSQAERCKEILLRLSKNPNNLKDDFFDINTISNIIKIIFDKYNNNKITLNLKLLSKGKEPTIKSQDEIIYGFGNIIQNAIKHTNKIICINISWTKKNIFISIIDDGKGFKKDILDNIGKPYISNDKKKGMGLGIFIAKNLIENINGNISFKNNTQISGSVVEIQLNRLN